MNPIRLDNNDAITDTEWVNSAQPQKNKTTFLGILVGVLLTSWTLLVMDNEVVGGVLEYPTRSLAEVDSWFETKQVVKAGPADASVIDVDQKELNLESKLNSTTAALETLALSYQMAASDVVLIGLKWETLTVDDTSKSLDKIIGSLAKQPDLDLLTQYWGWSQLESIRSRTINIGANLATARSIVSTSGMQPVAYEQVRIAAASLEGVVNMIGKKANDASDKTLYGSFAQVQSDMADLAQIEAGLGEMTKSGDYTQLGAIYKRLSNINKIPHLDSLIRPVGEEGALGLMAFVQANRRQIASDKGEVFFVTWLLQNPMRVETLVSNSSVLTRQEVKVKYFLPREIAEDQVKNHDRQLMVGFDTEKKRYYIEGQVTVAASDTKLVEAELEDVWRMDTTAVEPVRSRVNELVNSAYDTRHFMQSVETAGQISSDLKTIEETAGVRQLPEEKVIAYRQNVLGLRTANERVQALEAISGRFDNWGEVLVLGLGFGFVGMGIFGLRRGGSMPGVKRKIPGRSASHYQFNVVSKHIDSADL